ncbi:hypothetical protein WS55_29125 [Burkholderia pseudomultivorans]|nr:hypothetical protein WS55_29125 [Burkholderia pseudomultivorans]KVC41984.1 hypothetical protein WS56_01425 [Burkholderia pseudomultivorans]KWI49641.1 hypothetical protein WT72_26590 [Burkholderia pseudomultivorans]
MVFANTEEAKYVLDVFGIWIADGKFFDFVEIFGIQRSDLFINGELIDDCVDQFLATHRLVENVTPPDVPPANVPALLRMQMQNDIVILPYVR